MSPRWKKISNSSGTHPKPRHGHRAVVIKELIVVFGGGNCGMLEELYVFNTEKNHWFNPAVKGEIPSGRAAYGIVVDKTRILIYGGMVEFGLYSNELFELQASRWEWKKLRPIPPRDKPMPLPSLGHSFTLIGQKVFLFGGLAMDSFMADKVTSFPRYLNDLYTLDISSNNTVSWDMPVTFGIPPPCRESHSAVAYQGSDGHYRLFIYGGMSGSRLGDLWVLHISSLTWEQVDTTGPPPYPRSLHTATLIDDKMYVFGGWVPLSPDDSKVTTHEKEWKVTNQLACLDLVSLEWDILTSNRPEEMPKARAGHCAVGLNRRIYIWSGRDGYRKAWNNQVCCNDFWYLELNPPSIVGRPNLIKGEPKCLELNWMPVESAEAYFLQIQRYDPLWHSGKSVPLTGIQKISNFQKTSEAEQKQAPEKGTNPENQNKPQSQPLLIPQPNLPQIQQRSLMPSIGYMRPPAPKPHILLQRPLMQNCQQVLIKTGQDGQQTLFTVPKVQNMKPVPLRTLVRLDGTAINNLKNPQPVKSFNVLPVGQHANQVLCKNAVIVNKPAIKLVTVKKENKIKLVTSNNHLLGKAYAQGDLNTKVDQGVSDSISLMIQNTNQQALQNVIGPLSEAMKCYEPLPKSSRIDYSHTEGHMLSQHENQPPVDFSLKPCNSSSSQVSKECEGGLSYIQLQPAGNYSKDIIRSVSSVQAESSCMLLPDQNSIFNKDNIFQKPFSHLRSTDTATSRNSIGSTDGTKNTESRKLVQIASNSIKIFRDSAGGACISWEVLPAESSLMQFSVELAVRKNVHPSGRKIVYNGPETKCYIQKFILDEAEINTSSGNGSRTFYMTATNEHGTSKPMLINWLLQ